MPELEYETTDPIGQWAEKLSAAMNLPVPKVNSEGQLEDVDAKRLQEIPLDDVPLLDPDLDEDASAVDKFARLSKQVDKLAEKEAKTYDFSEAFKNGPYWDEFKGAQNAFIVELKRLQLICKSFNPKKPEKQDLKTFENDIFDAYSLYGDIERIARQGNKSQAVLLANLRSRSDKLSDEIEIQHSLYQALSNSQIDTSAASAALKSTKQHLADMNAAIKGVAIAEAEAAYARATKSAEVLTTATRAAQRLHDDQANQLALTSAIIATDIKQAAGSRHAVESSKRLTQAFDNQRSIAENALKEANEAISAGQYEEASQALVTASEHQSYMYSLILRGASHSGSDEDEDDEALDSISDDPDKKRIFLEATRVRQEVARVFNEKDKVKAHGHHYGAFERAYQAATLLTKDAQKLVVENNLPEAEQKNTKSLRLLNEMKRITQEVQDANDAVADQIELLKSNTRSSRDALAELQQIAEISQANYKAYQAQSKLVQLFDEQIREAERLHQLGDLSSAEVHLTQAEKALKSMNFQTQEFEANTPEDQRGYVADRLHNKLTALKAEHAKLASLSSSFSDKQELQLFENFAEKTLSYLKNAEAALEAEETDQAADNLENVEIAIEGMMIALERGVSTTAKTQIFLEDLKAIQSEMAALYDRRKEIIHKEPLASFLNYSKIAKVLYDDVANLISTGVIKDAHSAFANLKLAVGNMEACFMAPKGMFKGTKANAEDYDPAVSQPEKDELLETASLDDRETDASTLNKLRESITKLRQKLGTAEISWRLRCLPKDRPQFDEILKSAVQLLIDAEDILEELTDDNADEIIPGIQVSLKTAFTSYNQLRELHKTGKVEEAPPILDQVPDEETRRIAKLKEEISRVFQAIRTCNNNWGPKCLAEYKADFEKAKQQALAEAGRAEDFTHQPHQDVVESFDTMQEALSAAKANLSQMQKIFQASENLKAAKLKEYEGRIALFEADLAKLYEDHSRFDGWPVNSELFALPYATAQSLVDVFRKAHLVGDVATASEKLGEIDEQCSKAHQAIQSLDIELKELRFKRFTQITELQGRFNSLLEQREFLKDVPDQLKLFNDNYKLALEMIETAAKTIETGTEADAVAQLDLASDTLETLEAIVGSNAVQGLKPQETERFTPEEPGRLAAVQQVLQNALSKKPEFEQIAQHRSNSVWFKRYEKARDTALTAMDTAESSRDESVINEALNDVEKQVQIMLEAFDTARANLKGEYSPPPLTEDQLDEKLTNAATQLLSDIEAANKLSANIRNASKKEAYVAFLKQAKQCAFDAREKIGVPDYDATSGHIDQGNIYLKEAERVYQTVLVDNRDLDGMNQTLNEAVKTIQELSAKEASLKTQKKLNDFMRLKSMALRRIETARNLINAGEVKPARAELPGVASGIEAMKKPFKSTREKAKDFFTSKKSKSTDKSTKGRRK